MVSWTILVTNLLISSLCVSAIPKQDLLLVTVATDENDGLRRYLRSVKKYDLETKIFGLDEDWLGGDMTNEGGGQKVNILKRELEAFKDREDLIIMFTDSYDVVLTAGAEDILEKFAKFDARVVISAEGFIWPDKTLADKYPEVKLHEKRYLCSGGFIGYAKDLYEIVSHTEISNTFDDQLYYTQIFLDQQLRARWNIKLDKRSEIFMNLHGALGEIVLKYKGTHSFLYNVKTGTVPVVIHGNGPIKPEFNRLANYLADGWTSGSGCLSCDEDTVSLEGMSVDDYPTILMGIYIERPTPFIQEFLQKIEKLDYPKQKIDVLIHSQIEHHQKGLIPFIDGNAKAYKSLNVLNPSDNIPERDGRNWALDECKKKSCQYYFSVDADTHLDNDQTLKLLIQQNRSVLAAMIPRKGKAWSTFWGSLSDTGFYARSEDYMEIVHYEKIGLWNVPYITGAYLVHGHLIPSLLSAYSSDMNLDPDMAFCKTLRDKGIFMYVSNREDFGHLINAENYDISHKNNDLYEIFNNPHDWAEKYIHPEYSTSLKEETHIEQPCPDVFWFPIVTETFCDELVDEMEDYGQWSGGKNDDPRLAGGYENVPTDDIHMDQIALKQQWLQFLKDYVAPLATRVFPGYYSNSRADLAFVVKYNLNRQKELRPHHDSSTFTINIALNRPNIDFEGGGCRFLRYNCSVTDTRKGWMLMHPGRLTHYHEGLPIKSGTRYIMGGGCRFLRYNCSVTDTRKGWMLMHPGRLTHYHEGLPIKSGTRYIMVSFVDP